MRLTLPVSALKQALATALPFRMQRALSLPVLANVRLLAAPGEVLISATNLTAGITVRTPCTTEAVGETTVHAETLAKIAGMLEGESVTLEADPAAACLRVASGSYRGKLATLPAEEFPAVPAAIDETAFDAPAGLVAALTAVAKTASRDDSRPSLTGVEVTLTGDALQLVTTDGYRLTRINLPVQTGQTATLVAPAKTIEALTHIAKDAQAVRLCCTEGCFMAEVAADEQTAVLTCAVIDARFPDYHAIIPQTHSSRATLTAAALARATKLALLANSNANTIGYAFTPAQTRVTAFSDTQEASIELPAALEGPEITMHFNGNFLVEALAPFNGDEAVVEMTGPTRPAVFYSASAGKDAHLTLVMPMHGPEPRREPAPQDLPDDPAPDAEPGGEDQEAEEAAP